MSPQTTEPARRPQSPSERLRLAQAARAAALEVPGVLDTDAGALGVYVTAVEGRRLPGIVCAATKDGGYEISIRLIADLVALPALSDRVQAAVRRAARVSGVSLTDVVVHFADISVPGDNHAGD